MLSLMRFGKTDPYVILTQILNNTFCSINDQNFRANLYFPLFFFFVYVKIMEESKMQRFISRVKYYSRNRAFNILYF